MCWQETAPVFLFCFFPVPEADLPAGQLADLKAGFRIFDKTAAPGGRLLGQGDPDNTAGGQSSFSQAFRKKADSQTVLYQTKHLFCRGCLDIRNRGESQTLIKER